MCNRACLAIATLLVATATLPHHPLASGARSEQPAASAPASLNPAPSFDAQILKIAAEYRSYHRVSDNAHWAPTNCRIPVPEGVQRSESSDSGTHGRKLYFLFAKDSNAYREAGSVNWEHASLDERSKSPWSNPVGQALVKESFAPVEIHADKVPARTDERTESRLPAEFAEHDGKVYRTGQPIGLFIMLKLDPKTPGTDEGWIYATTSPDGKAITALGKLESCVHCHQETTRDRLYGPLWSWPYDHERKQQVPPTKENQARIKQQAEERERAEQREKEKQAKQPDGK